jgi:hypothetical protein
MSPLALLAEEVMIEVGADNLDDLEDAFYATLNRDNLKSLLVDRFDDKDPLKREAEALYEEIDEALKQAEKKPRQRNKRRHEKVQFQ